MLSEFRYAQPMAFHRTLASMLRGSLPEYLTIARLAIETNAPGTTSFCGYPAAMLLFAVADTIGSYHRGSPTFTVEVDGKRRNISAEGYQHLFILNSAYYAADSLVHGGGKLSERQMKALYDYFRNPLSHNGALAPGVLINKGGVDDPIFYPDDDKVMEAVNVVGMLKATEHAVAQFLAASDTLVPGSHQAAVHAQKYNRPKPEQP
jgi:hypothetical protein